MKITVNTIKSEAGLLEIQRILKTTGAREIEIHETETGKTWENFGDFNGNPLNLWLKKKGTAGGTKYTFIRASVRSFESIARELESWEIKPSKRLLSLAENEKKEIENEIARTQSIIDSFADREKMLLWKIKIAYKSSQQRRTFAKNRLVKLGARIIPAGHAREFERKIMSA